MEKRRVALVGGLATIGLMLVTVASASGVAAAFQEKIEFEASISDRELVIIEKDSGKETRVPLHMAEKGVGFIVLKGSSGGIHVGIQESVKEVPPEWSELPLLKKDPFEIAKEDERIQELIAGLTAEKDYSVVAQAVAVSHEEAIATLLLEVQGKYYEITIDMNTEVVKSVKESRSSMIILKE